MATTNQIIFGTPSLKHSTFSLDSKPSLVKLIELMRTFKRPEKLLHADYQHISGWLEMSQVTDPMNDLMNKLMTI